MVYPYPQHHVFGYVFQLVRVYFLSTWCPSIKGRTEWNETRENICVLPLKRYIWSGGPYGVEGNVNTTAHIRAKAHSVEKWIITIFTNTRVSVVCRCKTAQCVCELWKPNGWVCVEAFAYGISYMVQVGHHSMLSIFLSQTKLTLLHGKHNRTFALSVTFHKQKSAYTYTFFFLLPIKH